MTTIFTVSDAKVPSDNPGPIILLIFGVIVIVMIWGFICGQDTQKN